MAINSPGSDSRIRGQRAALYAFGLGAFSATSIGELVRDGVTHVVVAVGAAAAALLGLDEANKRLLAIEQSGFAAGADLSVTTDSESLQAEALRLQSTVARELTERDFAAAPDLAQAGMRYGAASPAQVDGRECVLAVFSRERPFDGDDVQTLQSTAALITKASIRVALERQLAERESSLRALLNQLPAIVWTTDTNLVFTQILGSATPDMPQRALNIGRAAEGSGMSPEGVEAMKAALRGETRFYSFGVQEPYFDVRVGPIRAEDGSIRGALGIAFDVTERVRAELVARASREELRRLAATMNVREEEQRRIIARDIHDEMGQRLTALRLELRLLADRVTDDEAHQRIDGMAVLVRDAADTVRRIAADLRPPMLDDFGFRAALETELESLTRRTGITGRLEFPDPEPPLDRHYVTALYRIVQESLTNVARHAHAAGVRVTVRIDCDAVVLEIRDDGRGITAGEASDPASIGLAGIRERAIALGGEAVIEGNPGAGTTVRARLPLQPMPLM